MEESKSSQSKPLEGGGTVTFNDTFDSNLTSLLTTYLAFDEIYCLIFLNKQTSLYVTK